ncbi:hypothetical protein C9374_005879 [Naegleria lovaniensis]|uniref:DUF4116 domain-containing protein n=1 Tax=Naegleria lovaniensis TaxID=51637 RepID=A0AA88GPN0_NAELO|nr:uncharacterized protein C9374_005879 [Naegleria lovaniensis]KAG2382087.1 hypothetical protein C9374_005879 [Naegleria lovaniensis]
MAKKDDLFIEFQTNLSSRSSFQTKKPKENVRMILVDFSTCLFHHDDENYEHTRNVELLLKKKFSWQQEGKKKWLLNRELKYQNFFPVEFMNDREFVLNHFKKYGYGLKFASTQLKRDRDFVLKVVQQNGLELRFADEDIHNDKEVVLTATKENDVSFRYASLALQNDREFVLEVVRQNGMALQWHHKFRNDKEVVLTAVKQNGTALASIIYDRSQNSNWYETIALEVIKQDKKALQYVSEEFLQNQDFMLQALKLIFPEEFETSCSFDYSSKEIILRVVSEFGFLLEFVSSELKSDRDVVLNAVKNDGTSLRFASDDLRNDKEIALMAVMQVGWALKFVSSDLKGDKEIVLAAVNQHGFALEYASTELRNDREVVLTSVTHYGYSLCYASDEMKKDRQVVLTAVKQRCEAIEFADDELKKDEEIVLEAVRRDLNCFHYISKKLFCDKSFLLKAAKFCGNTLLRYTPKEITDDHEFMVKLREEIKRSGFASEYSDKLYHERMEYFYYGVYLGTIRNH